MLATTEHPLRAWEEGWLAFAQDKPLAECPYSPSQPPLYSSWMLGWMDAAKVHADG